MPKETKFCSNCGAEIDKDAEKYEEEQLWHIPIAEHPWHLAKYKKDRFISAVKARGGEIESSTWGDANKSSIVWTIRYKDGKTQIVKQVIG